MYKYIKIYSFAYPYARKAIINKKIKMSYIIFKL